MTVPNRLGEPMRDLDYYLAIPYLLAIESVERPDGEWVRRAEFPELSGCVAEAYSAVEAMDRVEQERLRIIQDLWARGAPIPAPRAPLQSYWQRLQTAGLGFAP